MEDKLEALNKFSDNFKVIEIPPEHEFLEFKKRIVNIINLDLTNYKNKQMERRITSLMNKNKISDLKEYYLFLRHNQEKLDEFVNMLTINVSEFFRNSQKFFELKDIYLPELLNRKKNIKIWSAGCSIGAEIYSVAMILNEMGVLQNCKLLASDFDDKIINKAKSGIYNEFEVGTVPAEYKKYFTLIDEVKGLYQFDKKICSQINYQKQDLLNSPFQKD
ncbi:MAG: hypothetical protein PHV68_02365, partial [Candidatus Gastranaerophilales bacterium]|nr:hypothetical protein [Candidatus Gastranaerophilales bacterium]